MSKKNERFIDGLAKWNNSPASIADKIGMASHPVAYPIARVAGEGVRRATKKLANYVTKDEGVQDACAGLAAGVTRLVVNTKLLNPGGLLAEVANLGAHIQQQFSDTPHAHGVENSPATQLHGNQGINDAFQHDAQDVKQQVACKAAAELGQEIIDAVKDETQNYIEKHKSHQFANSLPKPTTTPAQHVPQNRFSGDLSPYENYRGPTPPAIEQEKYLRSIEIERLIAFGEYLKAANAKEGLAAICRSQGNERDAYLLEKSAYELRQRANKS